MCHLCSRQPRDPRFPGLSQSLPWLWLPTTRRVSSSDFSLSFTPVQPNIQQASCTLHRHCKCSTSNTSPTTIPPRTAPSPVFPVSVNKWHPRPSATQAHVRHASHQATAQRHTATPALNMKDPAISYTDNSQITTSIHFLPDSRILRIRLPIRYFHLDVT